ncbi:LysR family transcriptional regulator [Raoultella planticola]|uniref:LysR family transcriptional regulator n=1 Tax=Raoultella planticola TaxID=575 RepID=UPI001064169B|nr:LysR family transcriptional regulator [Raoultella planticola]TDV12774.1 LysR family transcriptional regulator [Raoultella planticola]TDX41008.1 LysR family transcriptional regulator [Raoultella planticola]
MDKFDTLLLFTRIVELESFSQAADQLGIPRATASNAIKALENNLECRLLERTTRHVRTSLDGRAFYERCVHILSELDDAESSLRHTIVRPRGILRVDLHGAHATRIVLPRIDEFHIEYPDIQLVISSGDRLVDLVREGVDCAVRAGKLHDSSLVARHLATMPQVICASPTYLQQHGRLLSPDDLMSHQCVNFFSTSRGTNYPIELLVNGKKQAYQPKGWLTVNDAENYVICALRGGGLVQLPRYHVVDALEEGRLVEVLSEWQSPGMSLSALYPQHRQLSPRVRVFIDWLRSLYKEHFPEEKQ